MLFAVAIVQADLLEAMPSTSIITDLDERLTAQEWQRVIRSRNPGNSLNKALGSTTDEDFSVAGFKPVSGLKGAWFLSGRAGFDTYRILVRLTKGVPTLELVGQGQTPGGEQDPQGLPESYGEAAWKNGRLVIAGWTVWDTSCVNYGFEVWKKEPYGWRMEVKEVPEADGYPLSFSAGSSQSDAVAKFARQLPLETLQTSHHGPHPVRIVTCRYGMDGFRKTESGIVPSSVYSFDQLRTAAVQNDRSKVRQWCLNDGAFQAFQKLPVFENEEFAIPDGKTELNSTVITSNGYRFSFVKRANRYLLDRIAKI